MPTLSTAFRNAACDAIVDLLDSGDVRFHTSGENEVATCNFGSTAFGAAATGTATANSIADDTDATAGAIEHAHLRDSSQVEQVLCTCGLSGSGADFILTSLTVGAGDTVSVTSLTVTMPASPA